MINAFLFLSFFLLYLVTSPGTVPAYRDSGDMINAVATLGIAHPPGYPLYVLMGKLFTSILPFANEAYRVNLFSAACAAGGLALVYEIIRRRIIWPVAVGAVLLLGLTPAVMSLARVSEMYTMAMLFAAGIIACCFQGTSQSLLLGSFLLGCGFGVHPTLLFLAPLLVTFRREAFIRLGLFLLGFTVVLFLWVRSWDNPVQNWGNPATLIDLWKMITRSNYGGLKLHPVESQFAWSLQGLGVQVTYFFRTLLGQWGWIGLVIGLVGLGSQLKSPDRSRWAFPLALSWLIAGPLFFLLSNLPLHQHTTGPILEPYLVLVNVIWALWLAEGLAWGVIRLKTPIWQAALVAVVLIPNLGHARAHVQSYRDHFYAYDLGRNILRTLPSRAVLYDPDDPVAFTLRELQLFEGRRNDVVLLNFFRTYWGYKQIRERWPDLLPARDFSHARDLEQALWDDSMKRRPFYVDLPVKLPQAVSYQVDGILYPIERTPTVPTPDQLARARTRYELYAWRGNWQTSRHTDFFTRQILNYRAASHCNLGLKYAERREWNAAQEQYRRSLCIDPFLSVAYNNMGVADFQQGRFQDAVQNYQLALQQEPQNAGYQRNLAIARQALGER